MGGANGGGVALLGAVSNPSPTSVPGRDGLYIYIASDAKRRVQDYPKGIIGHPPCGGLGAGISSPVGRGSTGQLA